MKRRSSVFIFFIVAAFVLPCSELFAHNWEAPEKDVQRANPIEADITSIDEGKSIFIKHCTSCHGENGKGLKSSETGFLETPPTYKRD